MNTKTMEGLAGASTSIGMVATPLSVAKDAERKGDTARMQRAMGYVARMTDQAEGYGEKAKEGMKLDAEEAKKQEKLRQENLEEKRKAERKEQEKRLEEQREQKAQENGTPAPITDTAQISEAGKQMAGSSAPAAGTPETAGSIASGGAGSPSADVTYNTSGEAVAAPEGAGQNVDVTV